MPHYFQKSFSIKILFMLNAHIFETKFRVKYFTLKILIFNSILRHKQDSRLWGSAPGFQFMGQDVELNNSFYM